MESLNIVALDTNAYVGLCKGEEWAVAVIRSAKRIVLPLIVLGELRAGFAYGSQRLANERRLISFLNTPRVELLDMNEETTHHYARLFSQLRTQGTPIPLNDLWIAALVLQHNVPLLTSDAHFEYIPQLLRV